jgi:hypothetical protein
MFIRYDPSLIPDREKQSEEGEDEAAGREFLFFGDVESGWRKTGEEDWDKEHGEIAAELNRAVWEEAAKSFDEGRLAGIFVSYYRSDEVLD